MAPERRIQEWTEKRVFFLTPQVLTNDLSRGTCPASLIKCVVFDEAHRATGDHAYCQVDKFFQFPYVYSSVWLNLFLRYYPLGARSISVLYKIVWL